MSGWSANASGNNQSRQLRVLGRSLPIDPLFLRTMDEYDLSLMLYRSWFDHAGGRRADHGLISKWSFEDYRGCYSFQVSDLKWSNGSQLTADHFVANLNRILKSKTQYGRSIDAIVDSKSIKSTGTETFEFCTRDKKPSPTLFNQFGSVFLSVIHPSELNSDGVHLKGNSISIGPYKVGRHTSDSFSFVENEFYSKQNLNGPTEVVVRSQPSSFSLQNFLLGNEWSNYYQTNTIMPVSLAKQIIDSKLPIWTRGFDRISLLKPLGSGHSLLERRNLLRYLGYKLQDAHHEKHPLQLQPAKSLQPLGYPLFEEFDYPEIKKPTQKMMKVLAAEGTSFDFFKEWFYRFSKDVGIQIDWITKSRNEFLTSDWEEFGADSVLFSFGVADPEPTTWLGLVFGSKFISYDSQDKAHFESLMSEKNPHEQIEKYRQLLKAIALKGGYLPLFHGATLSLGRPGMNFDLMDKLDETVDYSKIQFK